MGKRQTRRCYENKEEAGDITNGNFGKISLKNHIKLKSNISTPMLNNIDFGFPFHSNTIDFKVQCVESCGRRRTGNSV